MTLKPGRGPAAETLLIPAIFTGRSSICRRIPVRMAATQAVVVLPTRVRFGVLYFGIALAVIQYIDRVCISWSMPDIRAALGLVGAEHDDAVGWIFSAFTIAYALFEMPTGWLGDRYGPRKTLVRVVLWWSFFTAATGWAWSLGSLIAVRFLFGMGEAGCFPNLTRAFSTWLRPEERVRGQSILWLGARWGGAFTPLLVAGVLAVVSWRVSFSIFAWLGVVWAVVFYRRFRDEPGDHPSVNAAERALLAGNPPVARHGRVPWRSFLGSRTTWLLWAQVLFLQLLLVLLCHLATEVSQGQLRCGSRQGVSRDAGGNSALCRRAR